MVQAVADGGAGNVAVRELRLRFTAEPFVSLRHLPERAQGRSPEPQTVTVELTNLSACAVENVSVRERLDGHSSIPGSARLDGVSIAAQVADGTLSADGVALPAGGTVRFSYSTRVRPFGTPVWEGAAFAGGVQDLPSGERGGGPVRLWMWDIRRTSVRGAAPRGPPAGATAVPALCVTTCVLVCRFR